MSGKNVPLDLGRIWAIEWAKGLVFGSGVGGKKRSRMDRIKAGFQGFSEGEV